MCLRTTGIRLTLNAATIFTVEVASQVCKQAHDFVYFGGGTGRGGEIEGEEMFS